MPSQALLCRSRTVLRFRPYPRSLISNSVLASSSRKAFHSTPAPRSRGDHSRNVSSAAPTSSDPPLSPPEDNEKPKPRGRTKRPQEKAENAALPPNLNILWLPGDAHTPLVSALPPPELLQEALNNLLISFHPQTQHRAAYSFQNGSLIEPTLALYCPIEGGDYMIDETIRELAKRTHAEVVVLDAIEIAAGEWGAFGKAAAAIQLPDNPLHFASSITPSSSSSSPSIVVEQDEEGPEETSGPHIILSASQPFHLPQLGVPVTRSSRSNLVISRRTPPSKARAFFDDIVGMPSATEADEAAKDASPPGSISVPRIIYIRDYPTLAPSLSSWFQPLLSSVRAHRQGPMARPTSPVMNPMTIVLGMTPSIVPPAPSSPSNAGNPTGLLRFLINRGTVGVTNRRNDGNRPSDPWDEGEAADKARERRLRERLRKWESGDPSFRDELPNAPFTSDSGGETSGPGTELIIAGPGSQTFGSGIMTPRQNETQNGGNDRSYFRLSVIVPRARVVGQEKACRIARRRQINELVMRMAVGSVGGVLSRGIDVPDMPSEDQESPVQAETAASMQPPEVSDAVVKSSNDATPVEKTIDEDDLNAAGGSVDMWDDWGRRVEVWNTGKEIADRAVGSVMASLADNALSEVMGNDLLLDPTPIPWSAVQAAWISQRNARRTRRTWIKESAGQTVEDEDRGKEAEAVQVETDEVIEKVRRDPDLDQHESRLLGCIVDPASMSTTFNQVHLPPHTIDSVRTLVSLPLLHPQAFAKGILKQHAMTGALLFGPPGTGKTLVVRALAKESGARMLIIKPSDVMDMYVGEGEKLVRSVFSLARRLSPCVVFLDELDALFGARVSARETGGAIAHRGVITEFMQEMDGLKTSRDSNVIVIGATNRPFDLDDAVLRRLPRRLLVDLPGGKEREEILKILLRDECLGPEIDLKYLARRTESFSGSDLKHLCVSAALDAVKERITLPWNVPRAKPTTHDRSTDDLPAATSDEATTSVNPPPSGAASSPLPTETPSVSRTLTLSNFTKALSEITPSASESLGTLSDLRKWNEEFGEGGKQRKRRMWGGRFGFSDRKPEDGEGKVGTNTPG